MRKLPRTCARLFPPLLCFALLEQLRRPPLEKFSRAFPCAVPVARVVRLLTFCSRMVRPREELKPVRIPDTTLAFMFESTYLFSLTEFAEVADNLDQNYYKCWQPLDKHFAPDQS